jgi:hypothetical protein
MNASLLMLLASLASAQPPAPPTVAVLVVRRSVVTRAAAEEVASQVAQAVQAAGVAVALPPAVARKKLAEYGVEAESCEGARECVASLGSKLGAQVVVAVELGSVGQSVAIHLEVSAMLDGRRLAKHDVLSQMDGLKKLSGLGEFASRLKVAVDTFVFESKTAPLPPPPVLPEPPHEITAVTPAESVPAAAVEARPEPRTSPHSKTHYAVGGAALGAAVAAAALGVGFGLRAKTAGAEWQQATTDTAWQDARNKARTSSQVATASWTVAGVLAAAGTVCFIVEF